jgi:histidinol-phosphate aminotransferase
MSRLERPNIRAMHGYAWGEQPDDAETIKLNTNENPFPPSPEVQVALDGLSAESLRTYPQPTADTLRDALAALHGVERSNIIVTHGGDEALRLAFTTFAGPGTVFGMAEPSYSLYPVLAEIADVQVRAVPLDEDWGFPTEFAASLQDAALTCIVNPHAPSGRLIGVDDLLSLADALSGVLLVDEAYVDFVDPELNYHSEALLAQPNVLVLRTFSKGYSLAGLRLGYLLGDAGLITPIIEKTRDSYNVDHVSQLVGCAAISDQDYARSNWEKVRALREALRSNLRALGLHCPESQANFLLATVKPDAQRNAEALYHALKERGILVRYFSSDRLRDKLRITVGTAAQNDALVHALAELL